MSSVDVAPPRLSSVDFGPPRLSSVDFVPHRMSSVDGLPPRMSSANFALQRTSFTTENYILGGRVSSATEIERGESSESHPIISFKITAQIQKNGGHIFSLAFADGNLYTGSDNHIIRTWRYLRQEFVECSRLESGSGNVRAIVLTDDKVFSAHADHKIRVWRRSSSSPSVHKRLATIPTLMDTIHCWMNTKRDVFGCKRGRENPQSMKHTAAISSLAHHDDFLYSGSWDKTVKVWRISDLKCIETVEAHDDVVNAIAVGPDGFLFTGSDDCTVKIWRKNLGRSPHMLLTTLRGESGHRSENGLGPVKALALNDNGSARYAGTSNGQIICWEKERYSSSQMRQADILGGPQHAILCLTTGGNNLLFSGSADATVRTWVRSIDSGLHTCISTMMRAHGGRVKCIVSTLNEENEGMLFTGGLDGAVKLWRVSVKHR
jgi:WD40 repeat protein